MLLLNRENTADRIVVTLTEKVTVTDPIYLFIFTHVTTKSKVSFTKVSGQDTSTAKERYNEFTVDTSVLFADENTGQWQYEVYQTDDTDPDQSTTGKVLLENGKMELRAETNPTTFTGYSTATTFTGYGR